MMRGIFNNIVEQPMYKNSNKILFIELIQADCIHIDLIDSTSRINSLSSSNIKKIFRNYLSALNTTLKKHIDKRFIYFLGVREKVIFSTINKPFIQHDMLVIFFDLTKSRETKKIKIDICNLKKNIQIPKDKTIVDIKISSDIIVFIDNENITYRIYIHTFIQKNNITLGINTEIHYVGSTDHPESRPFDLEHRGLTAMSRLYPSSEYDHFIFYNLFKVSSIAHNNLISFHMSNGYLDEINKKDEGKIIELSYIYYFNTKIQIPNKTIELGELKNQLVRLFHQKYIKSIILTYEITILDEYYSFYSQLIKPNVQHIFSLSLIDGNQIKLDLLKEEDIYLKINQLMNQSY